MTIRSIITTLIGIPLMSCTLFDSEDKYHGVQIDVQGHRGARTVLPENTLPAFQYAMQIGVDTLELDLGVTKDNVVVVYHDQKVNTTLCQKLDGSPAPEDKWLRELSIAEVKALDCGSKVNPKFKEQKLVPGSRIPTLDEVFQMVKNSSMPNASKVQFNIETKSNPENPEAQPIPATFANLVIELVKKHKLEDRVVIQSFDHRTLREAKQIAPDIKLAALFYEKPEDWIEATQAAKADIISPYFKNIDQETVKLMQAAGFKVIPWTLNSKNEWAKALDWGVDGIITDDPKPLLEMLGRL